MCEFVYAYKLICRYTVTDNKLRNCRMFMYYAYIKRTVTVAKLHSKFNIAYPLQLQVCTYI